MKSSLSVILLLACMSCLAQCTFDFSDSAVLSRLFRDVNILASDSFSGRKSGSEGERKASRFITQSFQEAGLSAHGVGDSSFLQPFLISSVRIPRSSNTMKIAGRDEPVYAQYGFSPTAYSKNGSMEGNSYTMIDLARFMQPVHVKPGEIGLSVREAVRFALQQGISAVILYNDSKLNGFEKDSLYDRLQVKPEHGLVISVNSEIAGYLLEHPGANISLCVDVERKGIATNNVTGFIDNKAPYTIIIGAHYDHLGLNSHGNTFNGADDNASGTAVMMEMARFLAQHGDPSNNYLFIAFSGEEEGLHGSWYFVKHLPDSLKSINFMVNLDMVGRLGCEGNQITIFGTGSSPLWHSLLKETAHPWFRINRLQGVHEFTDHVGFYKEGIPVISLTTGFHYDYHTTRDDAGTLNYTGMTDIAKYLRGLIHNAALKGKAGFRKVSGWSNFRANFKIVMVGIDHLLVVGPDE